MKNTVYAIVIVVCIVGAVVVFYAAAAGSPMPTGSPTARPGSSA